MAELHRIQYGQQVITYSLSYRKRRTMEISVYPDLTVKVIAPLNRSFEEIKQKIHKRASWIMEQKYFFSLYLPKQPDRKYVSGETHSYLGKIYRLKVLNSNKEQLILTRGEILLGTKDRNNTKKNKCIVEKWYKVKALDKFTQRIDKCLNKAHKYGIKKPPMQIRKMSKRWGSCSKQGALILNFHLIKAPMQCIDYVIMHELCHLKYFNHSCAFYELFTKMMPDWEKRKKITYTIFRSFES